MSGKTLEDPGAEIETLKRRVTELERQVAGIAAADVKARARFEDMLEEGGDA